MKKLITILLILIVTSACSDTKKNKPESNNAVIQANTDVFMSAKINGVKFYSDNPIYNKFDDQIDLYGISKDKSEKILFHIVYDNGPSTYNMGKATNKKGNMIYTHNNIPWIVSKHRGEGTITLTEKGDYLIGEFSFSAKNDNITKQITEGKFKVKMNK
ncbi:MAG: hypothetical protein COA33_002265 [Fluviicola sp.]|nr:hypothetical protein [Fluviicola sp.]